MKDVLRSAAMAFQMFSVVPMPRVEWKKENMRYMLCCLPLVGVVIMAALWLWEKVCGVLGFGSVLYAAGLTLLPALLSGGIHLDGFCDTADALSSHAAPERKREILKDSHTGAFAILYTAGWTLAFAILYAAGWFTAYFALCTETARTWQGALFLGGLQIVSRALGAFASVTLPGSGQTGLLATFRSAAEKKAAWILSVWLVICAAGLCALSLPGGIATALLAAVCFFGLRRMAAREFGGMSGDLAGYLITLSQLVMLAGYVFAERMAQIWF